jgi:hypothetical protein
MARLTKHHSISLAIFNGLDGRVSIEASCNQEGPAGRLPEVIEALLAADLTLGNAICKTGLNLHIKTQTHEQRGTVHTRLHEAT